MHGIGHARGGHVHAFLLDDGGGDLTLIDTLYEGDGRLVLAELRALGRDIGALRHIVLTHAHRSHLGGLAALKRVSGATVYAHPWEADIASGDRKAQGPVTILPTQSLRLIPFQLGLWLGRPKHAPCEVDRTLADGDRVGPLHVLATPGHTPGHLAFHWPERGFLASGDAIATWPEFSAGWRAFNLNVEEHERSLRRMADLDATVVGVGHGDPITENAAARVRSLVP